MTRNAANATIIAGEQAHQEISLVEGPDPKHQGFRHVLDHCSNHDKAAQQESRAAVVRAIDKLLAAVVSRVLLLERSPLFREIVSRIDG